MEIIGFIAAIGIGLSLGLVGGGGSILTVPVLVYLFGMNPLPAGTYSLLIVGLTAAVGSLNYAKKGLVDGKITLLFALPSLTAVFMMRRFIMPEIPDHLFNIGSFSVMKSEMLLFVFAGLMILAAVSMIRKKASGLPTERKPLDPLRLIVLSSLVGLITGFVGVGGGFLIIPALVRFAQLPMRLSIGTSLSIIAVSSLFGVSGDLLHDKSIDYSFLLLFTAFTLIGMFIGTYLSRFIPEYKLKPLFGWFVLSTGLFVLVNTLFS